MGLAGRIKKMITKRTKAVLRRELVEFWGKFLESLSPVISKKIKLRKPVRPVVVRRWRSSVEEVEGRRFQNGVWFKNRGLAVVKKLVKLAKPTPKRRFLGDLRASRATDQPARRGRRKSFRGP